MCQFRHSTYTYALRIGSSFFFFPPVKFCEGATGSRHSGWEDQWKFIYTEGEKNQLYFNTEKKKQQPNKLTNKQTNRNMASQIKKSFRYFLFLFSSLSYFIFIFWDYLFILWKYWNIFNATSAVIPFLFFCLFFLFKIAHFNNNRHLTTETAPSLLELLVAKKERDNLHSLRLYKFPLIFFKKTRKEKKKTRAVLVRY